MSFWNIIGLIFTISLFAFVLYLLNKGKHDKFEKTQDLLRFKNIDDDGLIELPEGVFRAMIEIDPVNMYLKSPNEQKIVWTQFRDMLNALHLPVTVTIQSRHKDIKAYVADLRESSKEMPTEQMQAYGYSLASYLESEILEKRVKDHRYYVALEIDPNTRQTELSIPNETLAKVASSLQKKMSYQEAKDLARQELHDNIGIIAHAFKAMGLEVYGMDKRAVLDAAYSALNRDLAPVADIHNAISLNNDRTVSLTMEVIKLDVLEALKEEEREAPAERI
jgi:hypothetical protein